MQSTPVHTQSYITCRTYWSNSIHTLIQYVSYLLIHFNPLQSTYSDHKSPSQYTLTYPNILTTGMWVTPSFIQCSSYGNYRAWYIVNSQRNRCESFSVVYLSWKRVKSAFCLLSDDVNVICFGFATTINKSQRLFSDHVDIYLLEPAFWVWLLLLCADESNWPWRC